MGWEQIRHFSPRYLAALLKAQREKTKLAGLPFELMMAQAIAMLGNTGFRGWEEPRRAEEFYISPELRPKPKRMTRKRKAAIATMMRDAFRQAAGLPPDMRKFA